METLVTALICFPFLWAILPAVIHNSKRRAFTVYLGCAIVMVLSVFTAVQWFLAGGQTLDFRLPFQRIFGEVFMWGDIFLMCFITYLSFKYKKSIISVLTIVSTVIPTVLELAGSNHWCCRFTHWNICSWLYAWLSHSSSQGSAG